MLFRSQALSQIDENYRTAQALLRGQADIHKDFNEVSCFYLAEDGCIASLSLAYYFTASDEKIYKVSFYQGTNELLNYQQVSPESYSQMCAREDVTIVSLYPENKAESENDN